eukprot:1161141-Pelagomonas_calceolata.AAC.11
MQRCQCCCPDKGAGMGHSTRGGQDVCVLHGTDGQLLQERLDTLPVAQFTSSSENFNAAAMWYF